MGNVYSLEKKQIKLNDNAVMILEKKADDYEWVEVTYKTAEKEIFVGSYFTFNYTEHEWLEYSPDYIIIMKDQYGYYDDNQPYYDDDNFGYLGPTVKVMFSVAEERFVEGTAEEKLAIANAQIIKKYEQKQKVKEKNKKN